MILLECCPPFQWKPKFSHFGDFRRWMWGWFAVTLAPYDINELIEGIAKAGATIYGDLTPDVRRLIIAARVVAFEDQGREALKELDEASEAFADRVPWDDEPEAA